jgi:hypothetical protein
MITHVAIKDVNGKIWSLPKPNRHGDIFLQNKLTGIDNKPLRGGIQGFLNDKGVFLDRKEAFIEAINNNQVLPPYNPIDPSQRKWDLSVDKTYRELFSEDVW